MARRSVKSRIQEEFRERLLHEPFNQITVVALTERAGLARPSFYHHYRTLFDLLWEETRGAFDAGLTAILHGSPRKLGAELQSLWDRPEYLAALTAPASAAELRGRLLALVAAQLDRVAPARAQRCATLIAGAIQSFLTEFGKDLKPDAEVTSELAFMIYMTIFMSPDALWSRERELRKQHAAGGFPAAVSVEESLASDEYLISMIDGRRYKTLTRHLRKYGLSPDDYRRCFDLPDSYPMVARSYSERRRSLVSNFRSLPAGREQQLIAI